MLAHSRPGGLDLIPFHPFSSSITHGFSFRIISFPMILTESWPIVSHYFSWGLVSFPLTSYLFPSCLIMSHLNSSHISLAHVISYNHFSSSFIISLFNLSHVIVSHHVSLYFVSSHLISSFPINRIASHRIHITCHHFLHLLSSRFFQPSEKPLRCDRAWLAAVLTELPHFGFANLADNGLINLALSQAVKLQSSHWLVIDMASNTSMVTLAEVKKCANSVTIRPHIYNAPDEHHIMHRSSGHVAALAFVLAIWKLHVHLISPCHLHLQYHIS